MENTELMVTELESASDNLALTLGAENCTKIEEDDLINLFKQRYPDLPVKMTVLVASCCMQKIDVIN